MKKLSIVLALVLICGLAFAEITVTAVGETKIGYMASDFEGHDYLAKGFRLDQDLNISFGTVNTLKTEFFIEGTTFTADSLLLTSKWSALFPENEFFDEVLKPLIETDVGFDGIMVPVGALRLKAFDMVALEQNWKWDPTLDQYKILARGYFGPLLGITTLNVAAYYDSNGQVDYFGKYGAEIDFEWELFEGIFKILTDECNLIYDDSEDVDEISYLVNTKLILFDGIFAAKIELAGNATDPLSTVKLLGDIDPIPSVFGFDAGIKLDMVNTGEPNIGAEVSAWVTVEKATFRVGYFASDRKAGAVLAPALIEGPVVVANAEGVVAGPFGIVKLAY